VEQYKIRTKKVSVNGLCKLLGYSKQAHYKRMSKVEQEQLQTQLILEMIRKVRHKMPRLGARKLLIKLHDDFTHGGIMMGRDAFFDFLRLQGLLIKPRKRFCKTTLSHHWLKKYDNLIVSSVVNRINQVWVSDITYIDTDEGFEYLYLITDFYSKKILGYHICENLKAQSAVFALRMAIKHTTNCEGIIHHSDGGVQYCSEEYTEILIKNKMLISMTEPGSPTQNAVAERLNGILKCEWIYNELYALRKQARKRIRKIIYLYNHERPHSSCSMLTPEQAHKPGIKLEKTWKNKSVGTFEASAAPDVASKEKEKRLPESQATCLQHPSQPLVIPRMAKSPQNHLPLHQGIANKTLTNGKK
jgi:putative transposase